MYTVLYSSFSNARVQAVGSRIHVHTSMHVSYTLKQTVRVPMKTCIWSEDKMLTCSHTQDIECTHKATPDTTTLAYTCTCRSTSLYLTRDPRYQLPVVLPLAPALSLIAVILANMILATTLAP